MGGGAKTQKCFLIYKPPLDTSIYFYDPTTFWDNPFLNDLIGEEKVFYEKDLDEEGIRDDDIEYLKNRRKEEMENLFSLPSLSTGKRFSIDASSIKTPLIFTRKIQR